MNTRKILSATVVAALLGLTAPQAALAQVATTPTSYAMIEWGAVHVTRGQVITRNLALGDEGGELKLPVQVGLEDRTGNVIYRNTFTIAAGHTISLAIGPSTGTAGGPDIRTAIDADIYALIGPDARTIIPCLKVAWPPGPTQPILDQLTPTLEVLDALTGRVEVFANNPHITIGGGTE